MRKFIKILAAIFGAFLLLFILVGIFGSNNSSSKHGQDTAASGSKQTKPAAKLSSPMPTSKPKPVAKSSLAQKHHHHSGVVLTSCQARDGGKLPDPHCTPGATYARVTQATIQSTICVSGWTDTVRPDEGHTENLKIKQIRMYGYARTNPFYYEEDHLVPLELGGAPYSPRNLWPEYDNGTIPNPKDAVEDALNKAVCEGRISLRAAQNDIAANWTTAESVLGVSGGSGGGSSGGSGSTPAPVVTHHHHHSTVPAPTGCTPKTSGGNCYEPGEFCRDSDHGVTGVAGNGDPIKCEGSGSATWHWEHV